MEIEFFKWHVSSIPANIVEWWPENAVLLVACNNGYINFAMQLSCVDGKRLSLAFDVVNCGAEYQISDDGTRMFNDDQLIDDNQAIYAWMVVPPPTFPS